jgi:hypothetical protein
LVLSPRLSSPITTPGATGASPSCPSPPPAAGADGAAAGASVIVSTCRGRGAARRPRASRAGRCLLQAATRRCGPDAAGAGAVEMLQPAAEVSARAAVLAGPANFAGRVHTHCAQGPARILLSVPRAHAHLSSLEQAAPPLLKFHPPLPAGGTVSFGLSAATCAACRRARDWHKERAALHPFLCLAAWLRPQPGNPHRPLRCLSTCVIHRDSAPNKCCRQRRPRATAAGRTQRVGPLHSGRCLEAQHGGGRCCNCVSSVSRARIARALVASCEWVCRMQQVWMLHAGWGLDLLARCPAASELRPSDPLCMQYIMSFELKLVCTQAKPRRRELCRNRTSTRHHPE